MAVRERRPSIAFGKVVLANHKEISGNALHPKIKKSEREDAERDDLEALPLVTNNADNSEAHNSKSKNDTKGKEDLVDS